MQMTDRHLVEGTTPKITIGHRTAKRDGGKYVYRTWSCNQNDHIFMATDFRLFRHEPITKRRCADFHAHRSPRTPRGRRGC